MSLTHLPTLGILFLPLGCLVQLQCEGFFFVFVFVFCFFLTVVSWRPVFVFVFEGE